VGLVSSIVLCLYDCRGLAQQGVAERLGKKVNGVGRSLKDGAYELDEAIRKRFEVVRTDVHRMGAHHRVYARLHWDKALQGSKIEVHMLRDGAVLLRGTVPDAEAKKHAVALATDTVDVTAVVDELKTVVASEEVGAAGSPARR
jgi:hypothetical protein